VNERADDDTQGSQRPIEGASSCGWTKDDAAFLNHLDGVLGTATWTQQDAKRMAQAIYTAMMLRARSGPESAPRAAKGDPAVDAFLSLCTTATELVYPGEQLDARLKQALENPLFRAEWQKLTN